MSAFENLKERYEYEKQEIQFGCHCPKQSLNCSMSAAWRIGTMKYGSFRSKCYKGGE